MDSPLRSLLTHIGTLALIVASLFVVTHPSRIRDASLPSTPEAAVSQAAAAASQERSAVPAPSSTVPTDIKPVAASTTAPAAALPSPGSFQAERIQDPYPFPRQSFATINAAARAALVNILCVPRGGGALSPISGSGVVIDPRGVILTNAHVAQYVLLSQSPQINLSCVIRTGSPASPHFTAQVLYIPPVWVEEHAKDVRVPHPSGSGEHDYALLLVTGTLEGTATPTLPYLSFDTREAIGFTGDQILAASYPAEFLGGLSATFSLYPVTSVTSVKRLLTFKENSVDLLSLGGIISAQAGSSGGAVVNAWGRLIALIATTSEADTTDGRDLRAVTLSYIDRDLRALSGSGLPDILAGDVFASSVDFNTRMSAKLVKLYVDELSK